jgi:hypothetical protein
MSTVEEVDCGMRTSQLTGPAGVRELHPADVRFVWAT